MRDREHPITAWRREMLAAGVQTPVPLDELESHLRDEVDRLYATGLPFPEAFARAAALLGDPVSVQREFRKIEGGSWSFTVRIVLVWLVSTLCLASLVEMYFGPGRLSLSHVATVLMALAWPLAALVAGGLSMTCLSLERVFSVSAVRKHSMHRCIECFHIFTLGWTTLSTYMVGVWVVTGLASFWLLWGWAWQKSRHASPDFVLLLGLGDSLIVGLIVCMIPSLGLWMTPWVILHLFFVVLGFQRKRNQVTA